MSSNCYLINKSFAPFLFLIVLLSSCGLVGIHINVKNPKKGGSYPKETKQLQLLAQNTKYRSCFDVLHNKLVIEVNPAKKYISGKVTISAKAISDFDTLQIDLYKNMKIDSIETANQTLTYNRIEGAVFIKMPRLIKASELFSITIHYQGNPLIAKRPPWAGGFVWSKDKDGNPWIGVACESEGSSLWWPSKDIMNDEADSTDLIITVPKNLFVISNGILKDSMSKNDKTTFHWHTSYPINNYNVTLYVGNYRLVQDTYTSSITHETTQLNYYVLPKNYDRAKSHFKQVKQQLAFYEKMFGAYPWQRECYKLVESPYAGMEHQTAIAYGNGYKNDFRGLFDYIILHETAHEWWGNSVTAADLSDAWIHEGFASYCEALYVESISGYDAYLNYMYWQRIGILNKRPVVRKRGVRYFDYHDGDIYTKGSWVLHTLRTIINNDSLFFDILKTFRLENHQKQILSETFIDLVNRKIGQDYNWFFKQYLFKREAPIFEFCWMDNMLFYKWLNVDDDFVMPIEIKVKSKKISLIPTNKVQAIELNNSYNEFYDNSYKLYYGSVKNKNLQLEFTRSQQVYK